MEENSKSSDDEHNFIYDDLNRKNRRNRKKFYVELKPSGTGSIGE